MRIYVASSWRNLLQPGVVHALRRCGHDVYDFRHPAPDVGDAFSWREIDPNWERWTPEEYRAAMQHPIAVAGYRHDIEALKACEACVLVLPSGRSASWEFGFAMGQGKAGYVLQIDRCEPELMYREATILTSLDELLDAIESVPGRCGGADVVAGTRVPTATVWGWHSAGLTVAQIHSGVAQGRLTKTQVVAAIAYEMGRRSK